MWKASREFLSKHRAKVTIAVVLGVGTALWYRYYGVDNTSMTPIALTNEAYMGHEAEKEKKLSPAKKRAKILQQVRKQFDSYAKHFLPTLKLKIAEIVDISNAVRKIKEIRANTRSSDTQDVEARLWDEIKVSSLTVLFITVYMESIVCALLRIQLHVVAAYTIEMASGGIVDVDEIGVDLLEKLITATYSKIYDVGLRKLTQIVRDGVTREMQDWVVREKMSVQYDDLVLKLCSLRAEFEQDTLSLINALAISPESNDPELLMGSSEGSERNGSDSGNGDMKGMDAPRKKAAGAGAASFAGAERSQEVVNELLCRTWDIVDSHVFQSIFSEAVNTSFKHVNRSLREDTFGADSPVAGAANLYRTPPLASLLPQVKAIASRMLPSANEGLTSVVKEVSAGPILNALCEAVYDETAGSS